MSYHTWAVSDVYVHGVELNELFRFFCPLHFFSKTLGSDLVSYQGLILVCVVWFLLEFEWCFRYTSVVLCPSSNQDKEEDFAHAVQSLHMMYIPDHGEIIEEEVRW